MRVAIFSARPYDRAFLEPANREHGHEPTFLEPRLTPRTAVLAEGYEGGAPSSTTTAAALGLTVTHVPRYSPHAVAEHAVGLVLALNRKIHRAHARVREGNFALTGLLGVDLHGRTVGVIGTGAIGEVFARRARTSSAFDTVAVIDGLKSGRIGHLGIESTTCSRAC